MRKLAALVTAAIVATWGGLATADDDEPVPGTPPVALPDRPHAPAHDGPLSARVVGPALLRARPHGRVVTRIGRRTDFGGPQIVPVVGRFPGWIKVIHPALGNRGRGWIPRAAVRLYSEPKDIVVDLSERRARVRLHGEVVRSFRVGVGRAGHHTPTGRFAVTDRLLTVPGSPYGCCILALSGHQPHLPQGWAGGDRLAFHGTTDESTVGRAASTGCLRVRERDLRRLLRTVRVGTVVTIRR
ncbi:MAG TPA: L,D-transpeptidase [Solirubrobacteraceae bacterium]|jgi:lipoprotein-anchoring transpeptidase ErfK/SrfK